MTASVFLQTDAILNATALIGLGVAFLCLPGGRNGSPVEHRLRGLYACQLVFLAGRQVYGFIPASWVITIVMLAAAWIPLLVLLLVEQLLRRHAPRLVKWTILSTALVFSGIVPFAGPHWPIPLVIAFAIILAVNLLMIIGFILRDRKRDMQPGETRMADSMALALLITLPLIITEFRSLFTDIPVTLGTIGILFFGMMMASIAAGTGSPGRFLLDILGLSAGAVIITLVMHHLIPALSFASLVELCAVAISINTAILIIYRLNEARRLAPRRKSLSAALAELPDDATEDMIISAHPVTASGKMITTTTLDLYGSEASQVMARHRILSRATAVSPEISTAVQNLIDEHGATHLVRISSEPLRLLAIASGTIGSADQFEIDLNLFSRLAERSQTC